MINREDMLELTRRMTPSRTSFTRVAGGYMEPDGEIDESFNVICLRRKRRKIWRLPKRFRLQQPM